MRKLRIYLGLILLSLSSCFLFPGQQSSEAEKFEGEWKPLKASLLSPLNTTINIEESDGDFSIVTEDESATLVGTLHYDKKQDILTGDMNGITIDVKYDKKNNQISIAPRAANFLSELIVFERVE